MVKRKTGRIPSVRASLSVHFTRNVSRALTSDVTPLTKSMLPYPLSYPNREMIARRHLPLLTGRTFRYHRNPAPLLNNLLQVQFLPQLPQLPPLHLLLSYRQLFPEPFQSSSQDSFRNCRIRSNIPVSFLYSLICIPMLLTPVLAPPFRSSTAQRRSRCLHSNLACSFPEPTACFCSYPGRFKRCHQIAVRS